MLRTARGAAVASRQLARGLHSTAARRAGAVNSHNEWDPLEEVIVGRVDGATIPDWHVAGKAVWPEKWHRMFKEEGGKGQTFPEWLIEGAKKELDGLAATLEREGVTVRRPDVGPGDFGQPYSTPDFECGSGLYAAMPRDVLIVFGDEIIEAPMAWRSRFFEYRPFRPLMKEYFHSGSRWTTAPKPQMSDELYDETWEDDGANWRSVVTEFEPVFDAAEFTRMGKDVFTQISQVTNQFGIDWMQRHLGDEYRIHTLDFQDRNAMHIDGTFVPLGPRTVLINPKRPCTTGSVRRTFIDHNGMEAQYLLPEMFAGDDWRILVSPTPTLPDDHPLYFTSPWTASCNVLCLGDDRVIVEGNEPGVIEFFKKNGFDPIPVPFRHFLPFGGSFHCATCDVRRRGELESYFD